MRPIRVALVQTGRRRSVCQKGPGLRRPRRRRPELRGPTLRGSGTKGGPCVPRVPRAAGRASSGGPGAGGRAEPKGRGHRGLSPEWYRRRDGGPEFEAEGPGRRPLVRTSRPVSSSFRRLSRTRYAATRTRNGVRFPPGGPRRIAEPRPSLRPKLTRTQPETY